MYKKPTKRYWRAVDALYGQGQVTPDKAKKKRVNHEENEQIMLVKWLTDEKIGFYHIPNGGSRNAWEGARFKRLGVMPGIPDICIPLARKSYHGLYIELKRANGKMNDLRESQKWWLEWLNRQGYLALVAFGYEHARRIVEDYLR